MIAFAIVVICALPLITPHVWMIKEEKSFIHDLEKDRYISNIFAYIVENLHQNEIPWSSLDQRDKTWQIQKEAIEEIPNSWPYTILVQSYYKEKDGPEEGQDYHLVNINIILINDQTKKEKTYKYKLFIERKTKTAKEEETQKQNESENK